jgi:hypothetical protein
VRSVIEVTYPKLHNLYPSSGGWNVPRPASRVNKELDGPGFAHFPLWAGPVVKVATSARRTPVLLTKTRVLLCNYGRTVQLLVLEKGKFVEVQRYDNPTHVRGFSFSPDGRHAAAGSFRTGVYLWRLPDER